MAKKRGMTKRRSWGKKRRTKTTKRRVKYHKVRKHTRASRRRNYKGSGPELPLPSLDQHGDWNCPAWMDEEGNKNHCKSRCRDAARLGGEDRECIGTCC